MSSFFQFLAKTDKEVLSNPYCSRYVRMTQASLGLMVFLTGLLAFFSGGYAMYIAFNNLALAIGLGAIYSFLIMAFDREIVSATNKNAVWVRLPLAFAIGFIVAVPLELRLLQDRIDKELVAQSLVENQPTISTRDEEEKQLRNRRKQLEDQVEYYRKQVEEWGKNMEAEASGRELPGRTGVPGRGTHYRESQRQMELNERLLKRAEEDLAKFEQTEQQALENMEEKYKTRRVEQTFGLLSRLEALEDIKSKSPAARAVSWALRIFFILIEIFPALMKLFMSYNEYNALLEGSRRENIQRVHGITNLHLEEIERAPLKPVPRLIDDLKKVP